ncbi:hypothetical protein GF319_09850 [Candidatus Bathyarchaeota archaeon]|nr:hypothetical protein [Candidatus Bathyarchaeota archaeon]
MSEETETKKLLHYRQFLENRIEELHKEIADLTKAVEIIDQQIVTQGFKTPTLPSTQRKETKPINEEEVIDGVSITAKDGTLLGKMYTEQDTVIFKPRDNFSFTRDIAPFQSFLIDRVLANMKSTDEERASRGELDPSNILEYEIKVEGNEIKEIIIENYGEERRLREINSSLRWTFDKMFDKINEVQQG